MLNTHFKTSVKTDVQPNHTQRYWLRKLGHWACLHRYFQKPEIWYWNRKTVASSVLIGIFVAMLPLPCQMLIAAFCTYIFNANLPLAVGLVWLSNPITILPIAWFCLMIGCQLLQIDFQVISMLGEGDFKQAFSQYWKPLFVGCLATGLTLGILGYYLTSLVWRINIFYRWRRRS